MVEQSPKVRMLDNHGYEIGKLKDQVKMVEIRLEWLMESKNWII